MKKIIILGFIVLQGVTALAQDKVKALQKKIDSLLTIDQLVQQEMIKSNKNGASTVQMDSLEHVKMETFNRHIPILKQIIAKYGLPTYSLVGVKSSDNFIVMVNHSVTDTKFQERVISLAQKEMKKRNISGQQIALLTDKMLISSGRKQIYGTQCGYDKDGNAFARDLQDPANVDEKRKLAGLTTLKEYLSFMTDLHKQMNKKN
ncbi:DUF6624 domain-containing protein [Pedobacter boryungensis]|uniref:Uncharacterized protein n=1 Tax=Pedobacter boryungensis TaxID=869962 RepID=A0ABX2DAL5_9SPHI|nr:DUF6624 domain-containing protein [Pedobacter boryungensis]NQX31096.1 hypothetical protein [Pedobacter boryungensis]